MAALANKHLQARFLATAKERVSRALALLGKGDAAAVKELATELHMMGGEAAMVSLAEVAQMAWQGEKAARQLGVAGDREAQIVCGRTLRRLGYVLQELSGNQTPGPTEKHDGGPAGKARILVVDDSPVAAQALADVFEVNGFEVRSATTLEVALELAAAFQPAILVTDVYMPNLDVAELCRRFRELSQARRTSVVLVSGHAESELRARLDAIQPDAFVSKLAGASAVVSRVAALAKDGGG
jgi:CheY-like chemotaxis protein/HPt (histidine-containing phosphotransfer) domain-containing protein